MALLLERGASTFCNFSQKKEMKIEVGERRARRGQRDTVFEKLRYLCALCYNFLQFGLVKSNFCHWIHHT